MLCHGEHGRLQGTQGYLTILCLVLGHVISWRTWTPTRNSRHTQVHINYLVFGVISWRTWTPTRNSRHTQVHINYLGLGLGHVISWRTWTPTRNSSTHKYILTILCLVLGHVSGFASPTLSNPLQKALSLASATVATPKTQGSRVVLK